MNQMLKYFDSNISLKNKGMVLKLLNKSYNNSFINKGLNGISVKLYQLINHAIENNIDFYLQFKTLENLCLKVFDSDLKRWV